MKGVMKQYRLDELGGEQLRELCQRPKMEFEEARRRVEPILEEVRKEGDEAVLRYTKAFDGVELTKVWSTPEEWNPRLDRGQREAIDTAIRNVRRFHEAQHRGDLTVETMPGIVCMKTYRPIERVGLYVPGGTAPLPSTAIMLGVPAAAAGCGRIVLATPPDRDGNIPDAILYVARRIGAAGIVKAGGAQAIAAMAWGTQSVPEVDKILGPGNQYVTAAKMILQNSDAMVAIDLPAGPSEVLVVAGEGADPEFVASDLLSQAEHGVDSQVVLVTLPGFDLEAAEESLATQLAALPRSEIAAAALEKSFILQVGTVDQALDFSNLYAPEHLILHLEGAGSLVDRIRHAGSVFLGSWTPESLGDYASGTNHTLPTYGYARMYSGVSLESFQKSITIQQATPEGLQALGPVVETLAEMEGLQAHGNAVTLRLNRLNRK